MHDCLIAFILFLWERMARINKLLQAQSGGLAAIAILSVANKTKIPFSTCRGEWVILMRWILSFPFYQFQPCLKSSSAESSAWYEVINNKNQVYCIFVHFANILKWGKPCNWAKNVIVSFPGLPSFHEQMQFCLQGCLFPPSAPSESQNWSQRQCLNSLSELDFVVHVRYVILYAISVRCLSI